MAEKETDTKVEKNISDYEEVVEEVAEEMLAQMSFAEDGAIIDMFETGSDDPWQLFLFYGAAERALTRYRQDKRCKTVFVHVAPEGVATEKPPITPVATLLRHLSIERMEDFMEDRLELGTVVYNSNEMYYTGADVKNRHVVIVCDIMRKGSDYLKEVIKMCHDNKASHVIAIPLMVWNPELKGSSDAAGTEQRHESHRFS